MLGVVVLFFRHRAIPLLMRRAMPHAAFCAYRCSRSDIFLPDTRVYRECHARRRHAMFHVCLPCHFCHASCAVRRMAPLSDAASAVFFAAFYHAVSAFVGARADICAAMMLLSCHVRRRCRGVCFTSDMRAYRYVAAPILYRFIAKEERYEAAQHADKPDMASLRRFHFPHSCQRALRCPRYLLCRCFTRDTPLARVLDIADVSYALHIAARQRRVATRPCRRCCF